MDWRGCGRSSRPATGNTIANVARDICEFIDELGLIGGAGHMAQQDQPVLFNRALRAALPRMALTAAIR